MAYKSKFFQSGYHLDPSKYENPESPWAVQSGNNAQQTMPQNQSTLVERATSPNYSQVEMPGIRNNTARKIDRVNNRAGVVRNELTSRLAEETASGQPILDPVRDKLKGLERMQAVLETQREAEIGPQKQSVGKTVFDVVDRGAGYFNQGIANTADFVANLLPRAEGALLGVDPEATFTGQVLKPVTTATGKFKDYVDSEVAGIDARVQNDTKDSKAAQVAANLGSQAVSILPNTILAIASGGTSVPGQLTAQGTGVAATTTAAIQKMASNPMYWTSAAQSLGNNYEEAKANGATDEEAITAALLSTAFNSAVEVGGGLETLPDELIGVDLSNGQKALKWLKSTLLEEPGEEIVQDVITRLTNAGVYDKDAPMFSMEDENAIINPKRMGKTYLESAAVSGLLGGGQAIASDVINRAAAGKPTQPQVDTAMQETLGQKETTPVVEPEVKPVADIDAAYNATVNEAKAKATVAPDAQQKTENANVTGVGTVGDMGAKTSDYPHEVKESQSKTTPEYYEKNNIPEEGRADNHYTERTWVEADHNARARLEQDYDGEKEYLATKTTWSDEEMAEGEIILNNLRKEAEGTGDWSEHAKWAKVFSEHKEEASRALAYLASLKKDTGDAIVLHAAETLENSTKGTDTDAVMQTVSEYATRFDEAVAAKNVDDLINIIKETARTRKTGFYAGKLGQMTSAPLDWALTRIANYAKSDPAAGAVSTTSPKVFKVGDVVSPDDRGNYGHIVGINDDGTYDVHFVSKSGHEATKTFAAENLKSPHTGGVTAADISADPNSAFAFLKSFAAAGIENIASDTNKASVTNMAKTIRRNAMLSKFSTIMRNLVGNGAFDIADTFSRNISVPLDILLSKKTGTRSVAADRGYLSEAKRKGMMDGLAMAMLETSLDVNAREQQSKYENGSNRTFKMSGGVVSKMLSTWEGLMGYGLYVTDEMSKGATSAEVQRGLNRLYEKGKIKVGDDSLRDGGAQEALYRTFQDDTVFSKTSTKMRDALNEAHVGDIGLGDVLMPFAQVPANLAGRAIDYSPAGFVKSAYGLADVLIKAKKGTLTAAEQAKAVQTLGRNITGSSLIALAAVAAAKGLIRVVNPGGEDENKDKAAYEKMQGQDGTQFNLSGLMRWINGESTDWQNDDVLMSIAFLEPFNAHLTIGALLAEDLEAEGQLTGKTVAMDTFTGALTAIGDLPMFSAFGDAYDAYQYSNKEREGERWLDAGNTLLANEVSSVVPNAWKGIAQGLDPYQRDLYSKEGAWAQTGDQFRAVFDRDSLPIKQDSYGRDMTNEGGILNFMNTNILPGQITRYQESELDKAIKQTFERTGKTSVFPSRKPPEEINVDGNDVELQRNQQRRYQQVYGQAEQETRTALYANELYDNLDKNGETKAHTYAEEYAKQMAKVDLDIGYKPETWVKELEGKSPQEVADAIILKTFEPLAGDKKVYEDKYDGISQLMDAGAIDQTVALSLLPKETQEKYDQYGSGLDVSVLSQVLGYKNSDEAKSEHETKYKNGKRQEVVVEGKSNQDKTKKFIESLGESKSTMRKIWCCIYAESTCPW